MYWLEATAHEVSKSYQGKEITTVFIPLNGHHDIGTLDLDIAKFYIQRRLSPKQFDKWDAGGQLITARVH